MSYRLVNRVPGAYMTWLNVMMIIWRFTVMPWLIGWFQDLKISRFIAEKDTRYDNISLGEYTEWSPHNSFLWNCVIHLPGQFIIRSSFGGACCITGPIREQIMRSFYILVIGLNEMLNKQLVCWWSEIPCRSCGVTVIFITTEPMAWFHHASERTPKDSAYIDW